MFDVLQRWLADGKITQAEYDEAAKSIPDTGAAWEAREAAHKKEVDKLKRQIADVQKREAAKDQIIATFSTQGNPAANPDADPFKEVCEYINKKRGIR